MGAGGQALSTAAHHQHHTVRLGTLTALSSNWAESSHCIHHQFASHLLDLRLHAGHAAIGCVHQAAMLHLNPTTEQLETTLCCVIVGESALCPLDKACWWADEHSMSSAD